MEAVRQFKSLTVRVMSSVNGRAPVVAALLAVAAVGLLTITLALLVPVAYGYQSWCDQYPALAVVTRNLPPLMLLTGLAAPALINGGVAGASRLIGTLRFNRRLARQGAPVPPRLARVAERLGLTDRLTYLEYPGLVACCYGFTYPRVAISAGLVARLDSDELAAVLAHERYHVQRRDPFRYLVLSMLASAAFMFPVVPAVLRRLEARVELSADRAALAVAPRAALAGALLAGLGGAEDAFVGAAGLSATEARIAHLAGTPALPAIPLKAAVVSLALLTVIVAAAVDLITPVPVVELICRFSSALI